MNTVLKFFFIVIGITCISSCTPENPVVENKPDIDSTFTGTNVFIGDSHVQAWDLHYFFPGKKTENYGVSGENIWQINFRLEKLPIDTNSNLFIIAGSNNFASRSWDGYSPDAIVTHMMEHYDILLKTASNRFKKVYIFSVFPIGTAIVDSYKCTPCIERHHVIPIVNDSLEKMIQEYFPKVTFVDVEPFLIDEDDYMKSVYTKDGLHIEPNGYEVISTIIRPYVR